jgi:hypothetical protein
MVEVNDKLTAAFERFTSEDWLQRHTAVSEEDFVRDLTRNRLAVVMSREPRFVSLGSGNGLGRNDSIRQPLVIPLGVIVGDELAHSRPY